MDKTFEAIIAGFGALHNSQVSNNNKVEETVVRNLTNDIRVENPDLSVSNDTEMSLLEFQGVNVLPIKCREQMAGSDQSVKTLVGFNERSLEMLGKSLEKTPSLVEEIGNKLISFREKEIEISQKELEAEIKREEMRLHHEIKMAELKSQLEKVRRQSWDEAYDTPQFEDVE